MRGSLVAIWMCLLVVALVGAGPAHARKKKQRAAALNVAVMAFEGKGSGGEDVKEALELELELVPTVNVTVSEPLAADIERASTRRKNDPATIASVMKKRSVDVLITGERGPGQRSADALIVVAFASDGKPHFVKELPLGGEPDITAAAILGALKGPLSSWKSQRVLPMPGEDEVDEDVVTDGGGRFSPADVLMDEDKPAEPDPPFKGRDDPPPKTDDAKDGALAFNDPDEPEDVLKPKGGKRSRLDDDGPPREELARADAVDDVDDDGRKIDGPVLDDEVTPDDPASARAGHTLALSAAFHGATWQYHFNGAIDTGKEQPDKFTADVVAGFFPGGGARVDFWPLEWLGAEADASIAAIHFQLNADGGAAISPNEFTAYHGSAGAVLKARYVFGSGLPGLGVGARLGYRFWGASVDTQTLAGGDASGAQLTVVPGFAFHALAVGAEVAVPFRVLDRRLEIELRADGLPATYYKESPDNPGRESLAFGWSASLAARFELWSGLFVEAGAQTVGATVEYSGDPEEPRQTLDAKNTPVPLAGGSVLNWSAGFALGAGYMF